MADTLPRLCDVITLGVSVSRGCGRSVIIGVNGQLGRALGRRLPESPVVDLPDLDITDRASVDGFDWRGVDVVYNAAAYTAVDKAETDRATVWAANAVDPANLARAATRHGFLLVHTSTEYVFDGTLAGPVPTDAALNPLGVYGASKAAGELAAAASPRHLIARTSWLVGDGHNFVRTMTGLAERGVRPTVVGDQVGRPTFADDLAAVLVQLATTTDPAHSQGIHHVTNDGDPISWAGLARSVFERVERDPADVTEVRTAEYFADKPHAAARPANSLLDLRRLNELGIMMPPWPESLTAYLNGPS